MIVPFSLSVSTIVRGILSPFSLILRMMKFPGLCDFAIKGASTMNLKTFSESCSFSTILYISFSQTSLVFSIAMRAC